MECVSKTSDGRKQSRRDCRLTAKVGRRFKISLFPLCLAGRDCRDCEGDREADCDGSALHLFFRSGSKCCDGTDGSVLGRRDARVCVAPDPVSFRLMRARVPSSFATDRDDLPKSCESRPLRNNHEQIPPRRMAVMKMGGGRRQGKRRGEKRRDTEERERGVGG